MSLSHRRAIAGATTAAIMLFAMVVVTANVRLEFPSQVPGPPIYVEGIGFLPDGEVIVAFEDAGWAAIPFLREPSCVPADFNLLEGIDLPNAQSPGAFGCALTIRGFEIWQTPPPDGSAPRALQARGIDAVPIYFVSIPDIEAAIADGVFTITELNALPSLRIGQAAVFSMEVRPSLPYGTPGIEVSAHGLLHDGGGFYFQAVAGGPRIFPRHVTISLD
jgi:hypothetical protein